MKIKIYYHNTDCSGVVYYAEYLKFLEEARTEFFQEKDTPINKMMEAGYSFVVSRQEIDYKAPAFYVDILDIATSVSKIFGARLILEQIIKNQKSEIISIARTVLVYVNNDFKPKVIPDEIIAKLI